MWAVGWRCHFIDCVARKSVSPEGDVLRMCRESALLKIGQAKFTNGRRNKATWTWTWPERSQTLQRVVVWSVPLAGDIYFKTVIARTNPVKQQEQQQQQVETTTNSKTRRDEASEKIVSNL